MKIPVFLSVVLFFSVSVSAQNYDESKVPAYSLPDAFTGLENKKVTKLEDWENFRRKEVLYLFSKHVYGQMPKTYDSINFILTNADYTAMGGKAHLKQVRIEVWKKGNMQPINVVLFMPAKSSGPVPVMVLINNRGRELTDPLRKTKSEFWPAERVIDSGFAIASFHVSDAAPDNNEHFQEGILQLYPEQLKLADGMRAIGAWSWAASRVADYLATEPQINSKQVAIVGHSRGGKAALWAGAQDQRFAFVIANCSGNSGAALSRRMFGETVKMINTRFPYWFTDNYKKFNDSVHALPVDQHMLIGLIAPRLVYTTNATSDLWADPVGSYLSLKKAEPVFDLYRLRSALPNEMPAPEMPLLASPMGYHLRTGEHDMTGYDWNQFIRFMKLNGKGSVNGQSAVR